MTKEVFYYNGFNARKTKRHTRKQILALMNENGAEYECDLHLKELNCKSCKKASQAEARLWKRVAGKSSKEFSRIYNNPKSEIRRTTLKLKCLRCKSKSNKKCNIDEAIRHFGAVDLNKL